MKDTYTEFRPDGWPLCPKCGEEELYSHLMIAWNGEGQQPTLEACLDGVMTCYRCNWSSDERNMGDKEVTNQILDLLQEWAKQDMPSVEWLPSRVEKVIQATLEARLTSVKDACLNLGAEIAMATNALPERRIASVMAAFRDLEKATDYAVGRML